MSADEVSQYVQLAGLVVMCGIMLVGFVFVVTYIQNQFIRKHYQLLAKHYQVAFNDAPRDLMGLSAFSIHGFVGEHTLTVELVTKGAYVNVMGAGGVSTPTRVAFTLITVDGKTQRAPVMGTAYRRRRIIKLIDDLL